MSGTRWLLTALSFAVMVGASAWVVATNWPAGGMPLLAWPAHAAALAAVGCEMVTRAFKIQASAIAMGMPLRFGTALRVCLAGDVAAALTPARAGAEPARFLVLAESGMAPAGRIMVLFLELVLEMGSLALVCLLLALAFAGRGASVNGLLALVGGYSTAVIGLGAVGLLLARVRADGPPPRWLAAIGLRGARWQAVHRTATQLRGAVQALRTARRAPMVLAYGSSVVHVLCKVAVLPLLVLIGDGTMANGALAQSTMAVTRDTLAPLVLWPLALFYGGVVVPAPGGGGFIEGAFAATLKPAIPAALFAAALLWWRFYTFYLYLLVGGLAAGDAALRALRRQGSSTSDVHGLG